MPYCCSALCSCPSQPVLPTLSGPWCSGMRTLCLLVPAWPVLPVSCPQGCSPTRPSAGPTLPMQRVHGTERLESDATVPVGRAGVK